MSHEINRLGEGFIILKFRYTYTLDKKEIFSFKTNRIIMSTHVCFAFNQCEI